MAVVIALIVAHPHDPIHAPTAIFAFAGPTIFLLGCAMLLRVMAARLRRAYLVAVTALAIWALVADRRLRSAVALCGAAVLVTGTANSYAPSLTAALAVYFASIAYHLVLNVVLAGYIFGARVVMSDVLQSATSLYLVIGSAFAALLGLIEWAAPGSFVVSSGAPIGWQQVLYFSYITLTTVGYGDITPIGFYAQSIVSPEAITGTLYTVILLSRLVGMHASRGSA